MPELWQSVLQPNETLRWGGKPKRSAKLAFSLVRFRLLMLVCGLVLVLIITLKDQFIIPSVTLERILVVYWLAWGAAPLALVFATFPKYFRYLGLLCGKHYGLTNKRAIILNRHGKVLKSFPLNQSTAPRLLPNAIMFEPKSPAHNNLWKQAIFGSWESSLAGFEMISEAKTVYQMAINPLGAA